MSDQDAEQEVLRPQGLDLHLQRSDFAALIGASGSGKSTLRKPNGFYSRHTAMIP